MNAHVKKEILETMGLQGVKRKSQDVFNNKPAMLIELTTSSDSDSDDDSDDSEEDDNAGIDDRVFGNGNKRSKLGVVLPVGFLGSLPPQDPIHLPHPTLSTHDVVVDEVVDHPPNPIVNCKQFWKAGDYEGGPCGDWEIHSGGLDHVRVHPRFLHSNATSHKWALGAFAELLDNSLDELCHGATYVNIDVVKSMKNGSKMLLIEDNGGGMDPDKVRQCMSLGFSAKSKVANTIGQYGNGFKTSTMRLGADVIVFSRCCGNDKKRPTQSIGLLSYTFLRSTGKEDIVVPMLDYELKGQEWNKTIRSSLDDWSRNIETIIQWSPFTSESDLLRQFNLMKDQGTRIIIFNLWEDDQGLLELEFEADSRDIQLRGVNRDEKNIQMATEYPNSRHFLTYRHSLRSYTSILYLRLPPGFRIILRGEDVEYHNIVNDMMMTDRVTYRPQPGAEGVLKDSNMSADVTIGFVKDARYHIDVQGFNVYHKNRLIKPFWRIWNAAGSDGRGVIAHDKQGFERTTALARLETRLIQMQKHYWSSKCHKIGYAPRRHKKQVSECGDGGSSPEYHQDLSKTKSALASSKTQVSSDKVFSGSNDKQGGKRFSSSFKAVPSGSRNVISSSKGDNRAKSSKKCTRVDSSESPSPHVEDISDDEMQPDRQANASSQKRASVAESASGGRPIRPIRPLKQSKGFDHPISNLIQENLELRERLEKSGAGALQDLRQELQRERDRCKSVETELEATNKKIDELNKEQESLIDIFSEERVRRDKEEDNLRIRLKDASHTIQELLEKVKLLEKMKLSKWKQER